MSINSSSTGGPIKPPNDRKRPEFRERILKRGIQMIQIEISSTAAEIWAAPSNEPTNMELAAANAEIVEACRKWVAEQDGGS